MIWHELEVEPQDIQIVKDRYSALVSGASPLERILRSLGIKTLLITGTKTNVRCESTCWDAMQMDFRPIMISHATAALSDREHQWALENTLQQFGDVYSVTEVLDLSWAKMTGSDTPLERGVSLALRSCCPKPVKA